MTRVICSRLLPATSLLLLLVVQTTTGNCAPSSARATLESIIQAWNQRQNSVRSFQLSWEGAEWRVAAVVPGRLRASAGKDLSTETVSYKSHTTIAVDEEGRTRIERVGAVWDPDVNRLVASRSFDVISGRTHRSFFPDGPTERPAGMGLIPSGWIDGNVVMSRKTLDLLPIRLVFRPFDEKIGVADRSKLLLTDRQGVVDGSVCTVIQQGDETFWVDPNRSFVLVRNLCVRRGITARQVDIQYSKGKVTDWIPTSWTMMSFGGTDGKPVATTSAKVTECKLNSAIPEATFELDFPIGAWVRNSMTNERYIVRDAGKKRPIMPGEFTGSNFEQIRDSEPPGLSRGSKMLIAGVTVLVFVGAFVLWLVARRRRAALRS